MLWKAIGAARDLARAHEIAGVLIRYGFGDLVRRIGMAAALERAGKALHWRAPEELARLEPPARVRRALEELGPTFIKLGQILSSRVDLFPPDWIAEFGRLQDAVPATPFEAVEAQLIEDLGGPLAQFFAELNPTPIAAASLAQVYKARLGDGRAVVLKVRRPGIRPMIEADLHLLVRLAEIIESEAPDLARYRPRDIVREFTLSLRREMDFSAECRYAERVAQSFADQPHIVIPRVHWQWCGERLNVQDFVDGLPGREVAGLRVAGLDPQLLARRGAGAVLKMMLEDGFFHADPHPGNVFYLPGNRIAFIDFGMVGRLSDSRRYQLAVLLNGLVCNDADAVADILLGWHDDSGTLSNPERLRHEIDSFVDQYKGVPLKQVDLGTMLSDLLMIFREHGLIMPADLSLQIKAFITLEGMGRQLDPDFDMGSEAAPYLRTVILAHHAPAALARRGLKTITEAAELVAGLPRDLSQLMRAARRGKLQVQIDVPEVRRVGDQLDRAASRIALGLVTAALIIGTAIVISVVDDPALAGLRTFGLIGFLGAVAGGLIVLVSVWRSGRG